MESLISLLSLNRQHVKMLLAIAILVLASSTIVAYINSRDMLRNEGDIETTYRTLKSLDKLVTTLLDAETGRRGYFITNDKEFLQSYNDASNTIDTLFTAIKNGITENAMQMSYLDTLRSLIKERFVLFEQSIRLQESRGTNLKIQSSNIETGIDVQKKIDDIAEKMIKEENRVLAKRKDIAAKTSSFTIYSMITGSVVSALILLMAFTLTFKLSSREQEPKSSLGMSLDELETIVRDRTSEISQLSKKLNQKTTEVESLKSKIAQYENGYRNLYEQSHDAIMIFSPKSEKVLEVNQAACQIYGLRREEFVGLSLHYLYKNVPEAEQRVNETIAKGFFYTYESVHYKKDGSEILMDVNASVIDYNGEQAILSIAKEITSKVFQLS